MQEVIFYLIFFRAVKFHRLLSDFTSGTVCSGLTAAPHRWEEVFCQEVCLLLPTGPKPQPMREVSPTLKAPRTWDASRLWTLVCFARGHIPQFLETCSSKLVYRVTEYKVRRIPQDKTPESCCSKSHTAAQMLWSCVARVWWQCWGIRFSLFRLTLILHSGADCACSL